MLVGKMKGGELFITDSAVEFCAASVSSGGMGGAAGDGNARAAALRRCCHPTLGKSSLMRCRRS